MPTLEKTIFTYQAKTFINDVNFGRNGLSSMSTVYSSSDLSGMSDDDIKNLTDVTNKEITTQCDIVKLENGDTKVRSVGKNEKLKQGVYIRCYATYATDKNGNQFLYSIKVNTKPQYLPAYDGLNSNAQSYGFNVKFEETDNITFTQLSNLTATYQDVIDVKSLTNSVASSADTQLASKANIADVKGSVADITATVNQTIKPQLDNRVIDNHDGSINYNGIDYSISKTLSGDEDVFKLAPGVYKSLWGFQTKLNNYPSSNGAGFIIVSGIDNTINYGRKIKVIDSWGGQYNTQWSNTAFLPWEKEVRRADIDGVRNTINNDIQPKLDAKENTVDHNNDINNLKSSINNDIQPKLDAKENISDHKRDIDYLPQYRGQLTGSLLNVTPLQDGYYQLIGNGAEGPDGFSGYGIYIRQTVGADHYVTLIQSDNTTWRAHEYNGHWDLWKRVANDTDVVNLQNQVNGVLARQTNLIQKIISQNHLSGVSLLESLLDQDVGITIKVNDWPLIYIKLGTSKPVLFLSGTLLITSGTTSYSISNLDQSIKSYLAGKQGWLNDLHYLNGQSTSVGVYISKDGNWINFTGQGGYIQSSGTAPLS